MALNVKDHPTVTALQRSHVEKTLSGLRNYLTASRWIGPRNNYLNDTLAKITSEDKAGGLKSPKNLAQYVAASSLLHCSDGWSYLGKAIVALLRGDPHRTRHLAYYAELRAAMSILAAEGIGVFNRRHYFFSKTNSVVLAQSKSSTHEFVWDCLDFWAGCTKSGELFARVVKPYGRPLEEWIAPLGGAPVVAPQAKNWLQQWGMDLSMLPEDRSARNQSSYRPDGLASMWTTNGAKSLEFVREIWAALEPSPESKFEVIDRHILRIALESVYRGQKGKEPCQDPVGFEAFVKTIVRPQALAEKLEAEWVAFMMRAISKDDLSVLTLSKLQPINLQNSDLAMISRSALLLRCASGSNAELLKNAGISISELSFWWKSLGHSRGLWEGDINEDDILDLWADVSSCLEEVDDFERAVQANDRTYFRIGQEIGHLVIGLGSCERVAIWGATA